MLTMLADFAEQDTYRWHRGQQAETGRQWGAGKDLFSLI